MDSKLKRRAPAVPLVKLGDGPERVRFAVGATFGMPAHKERDLAFEPRTLR